MGKQIHIQVSKDKKEDWEEAVENNEEFRSLSDLIRLSVSRELSGEHELDQQQTFESEGQIGEILEGINRLESRIGDIDTRLRTVEGEVAKDPEMGKLSTKVFTLLPDEEPGSEAWEQKQIDLQQELEQTDSEEVREQYRAWKGTIEGLSNAIEEPKYRIEEAIEKLQSDTPELMRETDDGRYYKVA